MYNSFTNQEIRRKKWILLTFLLNSFDSPFASIIVVRLKLCIVVMKLRWLVANVEALLTDVMNQEMKKKILDK